MSLLISSYEGEKINKLISSTRELAAPTLVRVVITDSVGKTFVSLLNNSVCSDRILTFGIRSIRSPAKVGIGYYKTVNFQPGS